jgi:acetyltransferase-like isoleucine patch superfamily enzyme
MKRTSVKARNGLAVERLKSSGGPKKAYENLKRNDVAPGSTYLCISPDVKLGQNVKLSKFINLYGCEVGDDTKIGAFVEIQKNAKVGKRCKISSHTFICEGVTIEDEVLIAHNVTFVNDSFPRATSATGALQTEADWKVEVTLVKRGASIGSGATILSNVVIGENALIGAGCVVTSDVPANAIVVGNPGRVLRYIQSR